MKLEGRIDVPDPIAASHQFIGLCQNRMLKARLFSYIDAPTPEEVDAEVETAVRTFMAAFSVKG
jgi:hypothetical protein